MQGKWPFVRLREALTLSREHAQIDLGKTYKQITVRLHHKGVIIRGEKSGQRVKSKQYTARKGQFIVSRIDARNGAMGLVPDELDGAIVTSDFLLYDVDERRFSSRFLDYLTSTRSFVDECVKASKGTTNRVRLQPSRFLEIEIQLPPLDEQKRIVAKVGSLADRISEVRKQNMEAMAHTEDLMDSLVAAKFEDSKTVERKPLFMLTSKIGSGSTPRGGRKSYPSTGVPFIRSMNVRMRKFQWDGIAFISRDTHEAMNGTQVRPNDVLLNITGASIGRVACAPPDLLEANVNQHVSIVRPNGTLNPRYLMYWLSQPSVQQLIQEKQKGETREGLTKAQIGLFELPVIPMEEQQRIVAYLDSIQEKVDELRRLQSEVAKDSEDLVPSILEKALNGELSNLAD